MYTCPVCEIEEFPHGDGCDCAPVGVTVELLPCPFCGGPPAPFHETRRVRWPLTFWRRLFRPEDFAHVKAYVFCHECGAESPSVDGYLEPPEVLADLLPELMARAVLAWNTRNTRHAHLYEANGRFGYNQYPRAERAGGGRDS